MQGARIWLPNVEEFFVSLGNLITSAQRQRQTASYDSADFFCSPPSRKPKNPRYLTLRIEESFPKESELIGDLNELHSIVNELTRDFVRTVEECESKTPPSPPSNEPLVHVGVTRSNEPFVHVGVTRSGLVGRPRLQVLQEHLQTLHNDAGFRWADIGRILGISDRTLRRCYTNMYKRFVAWRRWWSFALTFLHGSHKVPCKLIYDRMKFV